MHASATGRELARLRKAKGATGEHDETQDEFGDRGAAERVVDGDDAERNWQAEMEPVCLRRAS